MKSILKKHMFEVIVGVLYVILLFFYPDKTIVAFKEGVMLVLKMLPMFICVVLFSSFLSIFLSPKTIQRIMGKETGIKGVMAGAALGTLIVGPLWVLFPLYKTLLNKGARLAIVAAMIGAFAIKTPWIPYGAGFLGWPFMVISIGLIMLYAVVEGYIMEIVINRRKDTV